MNIIPLFPALVFQTNIQVPNEMPKWCEKYSQINIGYQYSNRGGYHSPMNISEDEEFVEFYDYFVDNLRKNNPLPPYSITTSWFMVNEKGHYNVAHRHPNCDYSFVWYIKVPKNNGPAITFENDHQFSRYNSIQSFDSQIVEAYNYAANYWWRPIDGDVLLFPSDLIHSVDPNMTDESRIIFSGNMKFNN